jgi:hypothetical protein
MATNYSDITAGIATPPLWWHGDVPRYVPFHPRWVSIHATEVAYIKSRCQVCGQEYNSVVEGFTDIYERAESITGNASLPGWDPPLALSHCEYAFTSSVPIVVLEYWRRTRSDPQWVRLQEFEIALRDEYGQLRPSS